MQNIHGSLLSRLLNLLGSTISFVIFATSAGANCLYFTEYERLSNFCLIEAVNGKVIDGRTASIVRQRLTNEGYFGGLPKPVNDFNMVPMAYYSENVNGGNPNKKLKLNNLEFDGDPTLIAKDGMVFGVKLNGVNRVTYGEGRYLNSVLTVAYSYSPAHQVNYNQINVRSCSRNKVTRDGYIDVCASSNIQNKDINSNEEYNLDISHSKMLAHNSGVAELNLGLKFLKADEFDQPQAYVKYNKIHRNDIFYGVGLTLGKGVTNKVASRYKLDLEIKSLYEGNKYTLMASHSYSDGGLLLGVARNEKLNSLTISRSVGGQTSISLGYVSIDSTIDYFDRNYPIINLTRTW